MKMYRIMWFVILGSFSAPNFLPAQTWIPTAAPSNNWRSVTCSADGNTIVAQANDGIYVSTNSGTSWTLSSGTPMAALAISADGRKWTAVNLQTYIYLSTNYGTSWNAINAPTQEFYYDFTLEHVASSADGKKLIVGSPVYVSTNSGMTWAMQNISADSIASSADGTKLFAVNGSSRADPFGIYISTNSGASWYSNSAPVLFAESIVSSADGNKLALFAGGGVGISVSTNMGTTWMTTINLLAGTSLPIACSADGSELIASVYTNLFISGDSGMTWTTNNTPDGSNRVKFVAASADGNKFIVAVNGGGIWILQATPSPSINITPTNGNLTLSWLVPSANFVLQRSSDLSGWTDLTNTPVLNLANLRDEAALPFDGTSSFYRLKTP